MSVATEAKKQKAELAALRADMSRILGLTRRIAHDLNNVLQAITSKTEHLAEGASDRTQDLSQSILTVAAEGADLTQQLLSIEPGSTKTEPIPATTAMPVPSPVLRPSRSSTAAVRILVVDDLETIRDLTRAMLAKAGYEVTVAGDGAEAVAAVRSSVFDLVLMDLHMPVMNGLTATRKIRQLPGPRSQVPIVGISANVPLQHVRSLLEAGMSDHIGKPFRQAALLQKVEAWVNPGPQPPAVALNAEGTAFDDVCKLMGRPWVDRGLVRLNAQIDEVFAVEPGATCQPSLENGQLAGRVHALVSLAALLGFSDLSRLCSTLEEACRYGSNVQLTFEQAKVAALQARKTAAGLISSP